jgi:hypothetical protein
VRPRIRLSGTPGETCHKIKGVSAEGGRCVFYAIGIIVRCKPGIRVAAAFHGRQALGGTHLPTQAGSSGPHFLELPLSPQPKILQQISRGNWCFCEAACCPDPHQLGCLQQSSGEVWRRALRASCRSLPCFETWGPKRPDDLASERWFMVSCQGKRERRSKRPRHASRFETGEPTDRAESPTATCFTRRSPTPKLASLALATQFLSSPSCIFAFGAGFLSY